jgi:hypothetical protein
VDVLLVDDCPYPPGFATLDCGVWVVKPLEYIRENLGGLPDGEREQWEWYLIASGGRPPQDITVRIVVQDSTDDFDKDGVAKGKNSLWEFDLRRHVELGTPPVTQEVLGQLVREEEEPPVELPSGITTCVAYEYRVPGGYEHFRMHTNDKMIGDDGYNPSPYTIRVEPGKTYAASFYHLSPDADVDDVFEYWCEIGTRLGDVIVGEKYPLYSIDCKNGWVRYDWSFEIPDDADYCLATIYISDRYFGGGD